MNKQRLEQLRKSAIAMMTTTPVMGSGNVCHRCGKPASMSYNPAAGAAAGNWGFAQNPVFLMGCPACYPHLYRSWHYACGEQLQEVLAYVDELEAVMLKNLLNQDGIPV